MSEIAKGTILGLGNPLLDITAVVDYDYLKKWDLEPNHAILAEEKHSDLVEDMHENFYVKYTAGGSCQNSLRIAQWVLKSHPETCTFFGSIGTDFYGQCMRAKAKDDGLNPVYLIDEDNKTGICCVLVSNSGKNRSMVASLNACNSFKSVFLLENWNHVELARICYLTGFHLTVCPEAELKIAEHVLKHKEKILAFNLSAPYLMHLYSNELNSILQYVDILFGNETEATSLSELRKWGTKSIVEIASKIACEPRKNYTKKRIVIITQGHDSVIIARQLGTSGQENDKLIEDKLKEVKRFSVPVEPLETEKIVDTNAAGDAFVGGFLASLVLSDFNLHDDFIIKHVNIGNYAAREIIQQDGCTIPKHDFVII